MDRRQFLLVSTAGVTGMAGCAGNDDNSEGPEGPNLDVTNARETDPRNIDINANENEFSVELRNTGISGTVFVDLYFTEDGESNPSPAAETNTHMESGEEREVSFEREPPTWANGYEFQYWGTRYAADVQNNGAAGEVDVWLEDESTGEGIGHRTLTFSSDETRKVDFETEHVFHDGFRIVAEPVEE